MPSLSLPPSQMPFLPYYHGPATLFLRWTKFVPTPGPLLMLPLGTLFPQFFEQVAASHPLGWSSKTSPSVMGTACILS